MLKAVLLCFLILTVDVIDGVGQVMIFLGDLSSKKTTCPIFWMFYVILINSLLVLLLSEE